MSNAQSTRDRILAAIPTTADDDQWAAPAAVADVLSLTVKTVREHLNKAVKDGTAEVADGENGTKIYRAVAGPRAVPDSDPAESAAEATDTPAEAATPDADGSAGSDELSAVLDGLQSDRPGVAAALAAPAPEPARSQCTATGCGAIVVKDGRSWKHERPELDEAHKATTRAPRAAAEPKTGTCTADGCGQPITKDGRSWKHNDAAITGHEATTRKPRPAGTGTQNRVFKPGQLRDKVLDHLRSLAEGASVAPKDVAAAVGSSASSANYALNLLAGTGEAKVVAVDGKMQFAAA